MMGNIVEISAKPATLNPGNPVGSYAISNFESVNLFNGNLNVQFPLNKLGGRGEGGLSSVLSLQKQWSLQTYPIPIFDEQGNQIGAEYMYSPNLIETSTIGSLSVTPGVSINRTNRFTVRPEPATGWTIETLTKIIFTMPDGTKQELLDSNTKGQYYSSQTSEVFPSANVGFLRGKIFESVDGSNITFVSDVDIRDSVPNVNVHYAFPTGTLYLPNGVKMRIVKGVTTYITDRNGNITAFEYEQIPNSDPNDPYSVGGGRLTKATDSIGRQVLFTYGTPYGTINPTTPFCHTITFAGSQGANRNLQVCYDKLATSLRSAIGGHSTETLKNYQQLFSQLGNTLQNGSETFNPNVATKIILPDGKEYKFFYNSYAEIAQVNLPTGGIMTYEHEGGFSTTNSFGGDQSNLVLYRRIVERATNLNGVVLNKTTYSRPSTWIGTTYTNLGYVDEDTYENVNGSFNLNTKVRHYFYGDIKNSFTRGTLLWNESLYSPWNEGREYKTEVFDSNNNLLRRTETTWQQKNNVSLPWFTGFSTGEPGPANYPRVIATKTTLADISPNKVSQKTFAYDDINNLTDTYEYDFGDGSPGAFLRRSHTDYITDPNYTAYTGSSLKGLPAQSWVSSDSAGNSKVSLSQIEYDNYGSDSQHAPLVSRSNVVGHDTTNFGTGYVRRGNPTQTVTYGNAANQTDAIVGSVQYDILGNVVKTIDAKGIASTISYNDNFGVPDAEARTNSAPAQLNGQQTFAFATSATNPNGWTSYAQFDYFTGAGVDAEDLNGNVSSTFYNDLLDRPTQTISANNTSQKQQASIVYDDVSHRVQTTADLFTFGDNLAKSESFYDGLGRTTQSRKYEEDGGYVASLTEYDNLSRVKRSSNPFRPLKNESPVWSSPTYDALGRVTTVTAPDNTTATTTYSGNIVIGTDQAGKQGRSISNALGQLVRVDEPDDNGNLGAVSSPTQPTYYFYDTLGKMVRVQQGVQSRYFKYDSLGRLLRVRQPEQDVNSNLNLTDSITGNSQWTAGFTYDVNGNLLTATDAKNLIITSTYDNLNRVLTRSYSDGTAPAAYTYDDPNIQFSKGQLTRSQNAISASQVLAIDNFGRVTASRQTTDGNNFDSSYVYNLSGALVEETYPTGRKVKNTFEADGDLAKIETQRPNQAWETRAQNFAYNSSGAISQIQLGNNLWETAQFNNRLQVTQLGLGTSANDTSVWRLNYEFGELDANGNVNQAKNNGNVARQTVASSAGTFTQSFKYDSLERLKEAKETSGGNQTWIQNFNYDRYGNRIGLTQTINGQTSSGTPTVDVNTNRFTAGQGYTYDFAGNIVQDNQGRQFIFNGDNKQVEVRNAQNQIIGQYFYDADGKRIKKVTNDEITVFVYSGGKLAAEYSAVTQGTQTSPTPQTQYFGTDMLGSTRVITNQNAQVVSRQDYMPFGEDIPNIGGRSEASGYKVNNIRQKFTGYQKDNETGLDFAEARYYNNAHGRFTAVDPLLASGKSADPQTFNRYSYTGNNPIRRVDPLGLIWLTNDGGNNYTWVDDKYYKSKEGQKKYKGWTNGNGAEYVLGSVDVEEYKKWIGSTVRNNEDGSLSLIKWKENVETPSVSAAPEDTTKPGFLFFEFITGFGEKDRYFGPTSSMTKDIMTSPELDADRKDYCVSACDDSNPSFSRAGWNLPNGASGPRGQFTLTGWKWFDKNILGQNGADNNASAINEMNETRAFVGSYKVTISEMNKTTHLTSFTVYNETSGSSFFLHIGPDRNPNYSSVGNFGGYRENRRPSFGTTSQTFFWTEINPCGCKK